MENRSHSFITGVFVLLLGALLVIGAAWLEGPKQPTQVPVDLITTHSVAGLRPDALVRYRGVDVGRVESIAFDPQQLGQIRVRIRIDPSTPLARSTYAKLSIQGINGVSLIQLDASRRDDPERLVLGGDKIPQLELRPALLEVAADNAEDVLAKAGIVATRLEALFSDENTRRIVGLVDSLDQTSTRFGLLAQDLVPAARALPGLLQDTRLTVTETRTAAARVSQLAADADRRLTVLDTAAAAADQIARAASDLHSETLPRVNLWLDQLSVDSRALEDTLHQVNARPQSFLFGLEPLPPGPGEKGFIASRARSP